MRIIVADDHTLFREGLCFLLQELDDDAEIIETNDFAETVESVRQALGCAVIMVSHELHVVMRRTDRVICLNGHVCCQGKPEVVSASPEYQSLFGLDDLETAIYRHHDHHAYGHGESVS